MSEQSRSGDEQQIKVVVTVQVDGVKVGGADVVTRGHNDATVSVAVPGAANSGVVSPAPDPIAIMPRSDIPFWVVMTPANCVYQGKRFLYRFDAISNAVYPSGGYTRNSRWLELFRAGYRCRKTDRI